ncbi:hypothetical protein [Geomonas sp.]|uniref:hypothetical protein n=1 Tax=Geomonas sp. TaxID=2651584 RepID=UPI002B46CB3A|nr:hypothetical protein [Geomonas sp.]HJV34869.1 hypothetical protein [Geomonas sp.]
MSGRIKSHRVFLLLFVLLQLPLAAGVALFNYYIDPMWCFDHANRYNSTQEDIDDRQQKTNYLTFVKKGFDTLIIGNSRVKMMNQFEFGPKAFNYALNGMTPKEYNAYIDYARKANGKDFDVIVVGLSFAMTNSAFEYPSGHEPSFYFKNATRPGYRWQMLLSGDAFSHAWTNLRHSLKNDSTVSFDRNTVEHVNLGRVNVEQQLQMGLIDTRDTYRKNYHYLEEFRSILETIKKNNPHSRIVAFTTPVTEPLYSAMVEQGRFPEYRRFLKEAVEVFGEVHHFEYLNSVTKDYRRHFMDGHHYLPATADLMIHRMQGKPDPAVPADFGMLLNSSNFEEKLAQLETESVASLKKTNPSADPAASASTSRK